MVLLLAAGDLLPNRRGPRCIISPALSLPTGRPTLDCLTGQVTRAYLGIVQHLNHGPPLGAEPCGCRKHTESFHYKCCTYPSRLGSKFWSSPSSPSSPLKSISHVPASARSGVCITDLTLNSNWFFHYINFIFFKGLKVSVKSRLKGVSSSSSVIVMLFIPQLISYLFFWVSRYLIGEISYFPIQLPNH